MVHPQVVDGGDSLQVWWVAANVLNKQSLTANRGLPSSLGVWWGLLAPTIKKVCMFESFKRVSEMDGFSCTK
jgi:hypothetical protein